MNNGADSQNRTDLNGLETHCITDIRYPQRFLIWCRRPDSNWRPTDYKSVALPTVLLRHVFI